MKKRIAKALSDRIEEEFISKYQRMKLSNERKKLCLPLISYLSETIQSGEQGNLLFVCTHNSRRSQMAQFWAHYLSDYYSLPISVHSGGTEVTSCATQTIEAIQSMGIQIENVTEDLNNPKYVLKSYLQFSELTLYSKLYSTISQKADHFACVMCCAQAEESCPVISGSVLKVALNYADPKASDGTVREKVTYDECLRSIGADIFYLFNEVKKRL